MIYNNKYINDLMKVCVDKKYHNVIDMFTEKAHRMDFTQNGKNKVCFYYETYLFISIDLLNNCKIYINTNILQTRLFEMINDRKLTSHDLLHIDLIKHLDYISNMKKVLSKLRIKKLEQIKTNI